MRPKSLMLLVVAVGCGLLAMLAMNAQSGAAKQEKVKVLVVAADTIPSHTPLREEMVTWLEVPQSELLWDAVTRKEDYDGKAINVTVNKGEMITKSKLTDKFNASTEIPTGKRVVTVNVDISTSHSGQIRPRDIVDVFTTYQTGQFGGQSSVQTKTKRILSKIEVFSIDSIRSSNTPGNEDVLAKTVSLLVDPDQALVLMMASKKGSIILALRNKLDPSEVDIPILTDDDFDKLESSDSDLETEESAFAKFKNSDEYKNMVAKDSATLKELQNLKNELAKLQADKDKIQIESEIAQIKEPEVPSWKITVFDGRKKETVEFREETDKEATLPEVPKGDAPAKDDSTSGNSTTPPDGNQPTSTVLKADTGDK